MMNHDAKKLYDSTASNYDKRHDNATTRYMRKKEAGLIKKYLSGKILDIGCGTGQHLQLDAVGLDISCSMLKEAGKKTGRPLVQARAEDLPFVAGSFDSAICMFTVLNLCNYDAAAKEMNRILRTNGVVVVSVASLWDRYDRPLTNRLGRHKSSRKSMRIEGFRLDFNLFSKEDLIGLFENNGFRLLKFHGIFKHQRPYWGWYRDFTKAEKIKLRMFDHILPSKTGRIYMAVFKKML